MPQTTETAIPVGVSTDKQVRNLVVTAVINGVPTPVMMQVVSIADSQGNILDLGITKKQDVNLQLLGDIRKEMMIQNELLVQLLTTTQVPGGSGAFTPTIDLEKEYRQDRSYDFPGIDRQ